MQRDPGYHPAALHGHQDNTGTHDDGPYGVARFRVGIVQEKAGNDGQDGVVIELGARPVEELAYPGVHQCQGIYHHHVGDDDGEEVRDEVPQSQQDHHDDLQGKGRHPVRQAGIPPPVLEPQRKDNRESDELHEDAEQDDRSHVKI